MTALTVTDGRASVDNPPLLSPGVIVLAVRVCDAAVVAASGAAAYWLRHGIEPLTEIYVVTLALAAILSAYVFHFAGVYHFSKIHDLQHQLAKLVPWWLMSILVLLGLAFFTNTSHLFSRMWLAIWLPIAVVFFAISRVVVRQYVRYWRQKRLFVRHVAIIGAGDIGEWLVESLQRDKVEPLNIVGVFDDRMARFGAEHPLPIDGTTADLMQFVRHYRVDMIIVALPSQAEERLEYLIQKLRMLPVETHICPGRIGYNLERSKVVSIGGVPLLRVVQRPVNEWGWLVKRVIDCCLSVVALLLLSPVMLLAALAIKLGSPGPVLFMQPRTGFNGRVFSIFKFRTMTVQASVADHVQQATRNDARVTWIGGILRRTSIDELPQLFNVLKGDMSLVGPRPHAVQHDHAFAQFIGDYTARMKVKPGITGWAQISGLRGEVSTPEDIENRVRYDLFYVDNWSVLFDFKIILLTSFRLMFDRKAY